MTYAEFLKSQGASDEDIKVLDTSLGRKAFDAQQAAIVAANTAASTTKATLDTYQVKVDAWYAENETKIREAESQLVAAKANEARAVAALRTAHERGMIDVAKDLGYDFSKPPEKSADQPVNGGQPAKRDYFTREEILQIAEKEGDAIALAQDISAEHSVLFPGQRLNFRELRSAALAAKKPVEQFWMEKYNVAKAREDRAAAEQKTREDRLRETIRTEVSAEFASKYGNPDTRPLVPSHSPFAPRPQTGREKQPWEVGTAGEDGSNDRVRRATENLLKATTTGATH